MDYLERKVSRDVQSTGAVETLAMVAQVLGDSGWRLADDGEGYVRSLGFGAEIPQVRLTLHDDVDGGLVIQGVGRPGDPHLRGLVRGENVRASVMAFTRAFVVHIGQRMARDLLATGSLLKN